MWIKICGLTRSDAVAAALDASVDAIGFVFTPSPRQQSPSSAAALARPARGRVHCVAVARRPSQQLIEEIMSVFKPDVLQVDFEDLAGLRLPRSLSLLPVLRSGQMLPQLVPARVLFEGTVSGSGRTCDWSEATIAAANTQLVLAGGLEAGNVAQAIRSVRPFGVDVSSGVEAEPGIKSPARMQEFVATARAAFEAQRLTLREKRP
jgi:phosphoribosylanthranilate isomerase